MIAKVPSDGRRGRCFSGCRGADELVRIFDPQNFCHSILLYIDGSRAVYRICLSFRGPQMNRCRLIDEVSLVSAAWQLHSLEE